MKERGAFVLGAMHVWRPDLSRDARIYQGICCVLHCKYCTSSVSKALLEKNAACKFRLFSENDCSLATAIAVASPTPP
jgi:hypothetical protein